MLYNKFEFCVTNNGKNTIYYKQNKGVHQGSAVSGPLFLYVAEIFTINVRNNGRIHGITIGNNEEKISQYADDTNLRSKYETDSINEIIKELDRFHENTGLKVNYDFQGAA